MRVPRVCDERSKDQMRKPTLKDRASNYCSRTCPVLTGMMSYVWAWAERCWMAGYKAGKADGAASARRAGGDE